MSNGSEAMNLSGLETHARELYAFERLADPSLPAWEAATYMTRSRWLRAAASATVERAA